MVAFKTADLKIQQENLYAYTLAPSHHLKSVTASAISFLGDDGTRSPSPVQHAEFGGHESVLDGLLVEFDSYLSEPRMQLCKSVSEGSDTVVQWCDPLRYWTVRQSLTPQSSL